MGPCLCDSLCVSGAGRHSEFENVTRLADSFPDAAVTTITIANVFVLTVCWGSSGGSGVKKPPANAGDTGD